VSPSWYFAVATVTALLGVMALPVAQALLALDTTAQVYGTAVMTIAVGAPPLFALAGVIALFRREAPPSG
jgi:ABC-type transport system involved in cytochrome c biogenesis permease component